MAAPLREREPLGALSTNARDWHALSQGDVLRLLQTAASGLSDTEAAKRLEQYGANSLIAPPADPAWRILARQFRSVVVGLLVLATVLAWWTSDVADAATIAAVLFLNVALGFVTELRARRAMDALLQLDVPSAVVVRAGSTRSVRRVRLWRRTRVFYPRPHSRPWRHPSGVSPRVS
jgi:Ca2+-transporting ATPase